MSKRWLVMLEVESSLPSTQLAMMVQMFPGVFDVRVADSFVQDDAEDSQRSVKVRPNSKPKSKLGKSETPKGRL